MLHLVNRPIWMDKSLGIPVNPFIKLGICLRSLINANLVRNNEAGSRFPSYDHVAKITVVGLDVALACAKFQSLLMLALCLPQ
jgi:hypothetical protein